MTQTALVAGATGLVGSELLHRLLADARYGKVTALTRRPLELVHPRLENLIVSFNELGAQGQALRADHVFCCLGTTRRQAGSKAALERVDYHMVLDLARAAHAAGAERFLVVSAVGARANSPVHYLRVKGRMEQAVADVGFAATHILQPSLLLGARAQLRPLERCAQRCAPLLSRALPDALAAWRPVPAADVAARLIELAQLDRSGTYRHVMAPPPPP